jgi:MFS family permease
MIAAVLGFGLGGIIVEKWGVWTAFIVDAFTFFLSGFFILLMRVKETASFNPKDIIRIGKDALLKVKNSFLGEIKEGIRYVLSSPETKYSAKVFFVLFAAVGSLYTIFIVFIQNVFSTVTADLGWLAVGAGGGLFLGSILYGKIGIKLPVKKVINLSLLTSSLYLIFFVVILNTYHNKIFAFLSCCLLGILVSPIVIAVNTLIHQESENNFWGRIFSYLEVVIHLAFIVFMFTASYLAEKFTPFTIIVCVGIIISLFSLITLIKQK